MDDSESIYEHLFPIALEVEQGTRYFWCSCGNSKKQPLCDRENCGANAVEFRADLTEEVYFCACKQTKNPPFCDGSHAKLLLKAVHERKNR